MLRWSDLWILVDRVDQANGEGGPGASLKDPYTIEREQSTLYVEPAAETQPPKDSVSDGGLTARAYEVAES